MLQYHTIRGTLDSEAEKKRLDFKNTKGNAQLLSVRSQSFSEFIRSITECTYLIPNPNQGAISK